MSAGAGILAGLRVLDLTRMLSGPYCTMMLADHGAEVIKIESAGGDTSRATGPFRDDDPEQEWGGYFVSLNRSKRSVLLDLKSPEGRADFRALAATADVVVENFRPGVMERLGLSYETLAAENPRLVYAAIRGFGDPRTGTSPYADWPSYDVVAQAMGGLIALTGPDADTPTKVGPGIGDVFAGLTMAFGIVAAVRAAEATGRGQFVDVAMYDAMISLCERAVYMHDFDGSVPGPAGNGHPLLAPFGVFPAADGHVALGIVDDAFWRALCRAMGHEALAEDPRYATRAARRAASAEVSALVSGWTGSLTRAELTARLGGRVPFGPVNTVADIFADPHVAARGMIAEVPHAVAGARPWRVAANPLRFASSPAPAPATPPRLGGDNAALSATTAGEGSQVSPRALRDAFGAFATGVAVVTTRQPDGTPRGLTANSLTSVSLEPPLLLVCIAKTAHSHGSFLAACHFAVNVLGEDQKAVSGLFASREPDKFGQAAWRPGPMDLPLIDGALAQFACTRERLVDAGDHTILIGRIRDVSLREGPPLGYFRGAYFSIGLEEPLVQAAASGGGARIGAVLEQGGKVLLAERDGRLALPLSAGPVPSLEGLKASLAAQGLRAEIEFLYAVFEEPDSARHGIYYHGSVVGEVPEGMRLYELDAIPWDRVTDPPERQMLQRYAEEYRHGTLGIYQGTGTDGRVRRIT